MTTTAVAWPDAGPDVLAPVAEHDDLRAVARAILGKHATIDQVRASVETGGPSGPGPAWGSLTAELGIASIAVPEHLGGAGYGARELGVVLEETGGHLVPDPVLSSAVLGTQALTLADDPTRVASLLADVARGDRLVTVWFGPADAVTAEPADDGWRASGRLDRVLHGGTVDHVVVRAATVEGTVLLVVDVSGDRTERRVVDLTRSQADLDLSAAPARLVVGPRHHAAAWSRLEALRDVAVAAEHTGIVTHLLAMTVDYVGTREQFGRPIGSFQAIKHRLADVLVDRERCCSASRYAAAVLDADPAAAAVPAAVAAAVCSEAVVRTAHEAIQLHGGIGFTWEHPAHLYLRRALGDEGLFGSARDHRSRLASLLDL
ncbi:acyl-CoA dehydrogenase family protein [Nocardioides plantarum]|uniref:Acyl-CoA dehydrogenase family protein n=1 Tax=Nocardioides plantarum TaxID=29299 RepID=A0ABV5KEV6_9ACTN|nr:acyl-CoA dehydrogenase family protein [Nocardioides plantarum]